MKQSYRYINQIFYNDNKFDIPESLDSLEKYFLSNEYIFSLKENEKREKILEEKIPQKNPDEKLKEKKMEENISQKIPEEKLKEKKMEEKISQKISEKFSEEKIKWFHPKQIDTIFWCVYSFVHGFDEYNEIGHSYGNSILEEKMKIIEFIKKNPKILKESNIKITNAGIQEVVSEFMVDSTTSFHGIAALAIYYKIHIYLIHNEKKIFLKFLHGESDKKCYIYYDTFSRGQIKYKIPISGMEVPHIDLNTMVCLESHVKPFRPASHYKMEDLVSIAHKIGYVYETRMKKLELYDKLTELCSWL